MKRNKATMDIKQNYDGRLTELQETLDRTVTDIKRNYDGHLTKL
jgi:hypothetical protein